MTFPHFFIDRPIFAAVLSIAVLIAGLGPVRTWLLLRHSSGSRFEALLDTLFRTRTS